MRLFLRISSMTLVYALLAGPAAPGNWLLGAAFALLLALRGGVGPPAASPAGLWRVALVPWLMLGIILRIATGAFQMIRFLLIQRDWSRVGFVTCRTPAETADGKALLALAESVSPGSIAASADAERISASAIGASEPEEHCAALGRWYARFQKRILP